MNSLRKLALSSCCDSTSTIKLILYNVTVAVSQNLRPWVCVESVGGGGPCVFKAHWHHPEAPHSTCIHLWKLFLLKGMCYTLWLCLYDIVIWAFQCSSVLYCECFFSSLNHPLLNKHKNNSSPDAKVFKSNTLSNTSCFKEICVKSWFEGIHLDSYRNLIMQANNNTHKTMNRIEKQWCCRAFCFFFLLKWDFCFLTWG